MAFAAAQSDPQRMQAPSSYSSGLAAQQYSPHSQQSRDARYANQTMASNPAPSSRRQGRQSGYDHHSSPSTSQPRPSPATNVQNASTSSPAAGTSQSNSRNPRSTAPDYFDGAPLPPPRSSSTQTGSPTMNASSSAPTETRRQTRQSVDDPRSRDGRNRTKPEPTAAHSPREVTSGTPTSASRSHRRGPVSPEGQQTASSSRTSGQRSHISQQSRPDGASTSNGLPAPVSRENSEIINRVVVSNPAVDIARVEERMAEARPAALPTEGAGPDVTSNEDFDEGSRKRQEYSKQSTRRKDLQFGDYMLGQTLGEGEFGKVKLGWKKDGSVQVAIKLIRQESVATNPNRLPKIEREISILKELSHPNIVRLHEMAENERYIGIVLEYASGGELFDYILNQRYLKDPAARRLFAQLVSGVGYLHKKGIVHRDLKLENLLLDRNRNIIITDFGFANSFNPADDLSEDVLYNLSNRDFVRKYRLDRQDARGMRKGDLMQTSCGSPCYAAPELVVSDSLYTGRKVDVWSCGVILYAMLAGYLPFDDDPANPEGDNINLLYKYITTTALTFPEYVTPHARDLLRRILVPDPRKRADLFEVARHSWLSEYHHVVSHVTSSTTNIAEISNSTVPAEDQDEVPALARSASVREPAKSPTQTGPPAAEATDNQQQDGYTREEPDESGSRRRNVNRHTIQPEYVEPQFHTTRGEAPTSNGNAAPATRRNRSGSQGSGSIQNGSQQLATRTKPLPQDPPLMSNEAVKVADYPTDSASNGQQRMAAPTRPGRDVRRSVSESTEAVQSSTSQPSYAPGQTTRPSTGTTASASGRSNPRLPKRGSYGQPVAPTVEAANAHGRVTQPKNGRGYNISGPIPQGEAARPIHRVPVPNSNPNNNPEAAYQPPPTSAKTHHRRSSTLSGLGEKLFGRSNSVRSNKQQQQGDALKARKERKYPPTSMKESYPVENAPRTSTDSKRSFSFGANKKKSVELESQQPMEEKPRRFSSLIPASFSLRGLTGGGASGSDGSRDQDGGSYSPVPRAGDFPQPPSGGRPSMSQGHRPSPGQYGDETQPHQNQSQGQGRGQSHDQAWGETQPVGQDGPFDQYDQQPRSARSNFSRPPQRQSYQQPQSTQSRVPNDVYGGTGVYSGAPSQQQRPQQPQQQQSQQPQHQRQQSSSYSSQAPQAQYNSVNQTRPIYPDGFNSGTNTNSYDPSSGRNQNQNPNPNRQGRGVLQKHDRNFKNAYDYEQGPSRHEGSSGPARKVMDYFRRRKARADSYQ